MDVRHGAFAGFDNDFAPLLGVFDGVRNEIDIRVEKVAVHNYLLACCEKIEGIEQVARTMLAPTRSRCELRRSGAVMQRRRSVCAEAAGEGDLLTRCGQL